MMISMRELLARLLLLLLLLLTNFPASSCFCAASNFLRRSTISCSMKRAAASSSSSSWSTTDPDHAREAKKKLSVWPLDEYNAHLLDEVHPRNFDDPAISQEQDEECYVFDLIAVGAGAGGLVSSRQSARRGAKSAMISSNLAGGDCLNVGCVPSKALIRSARAVAEVRRAEEFGVILPGDGKIQVDFRKVMERLRMLRSHIADVDSHGTTVQAGARVYQGKGRFTGPDKIEVNGKTLRFKKAVVATGGRPDIPDNIPGLKDAPYTTNEILFNLEALPPRMVILGAGVVALEMAQCFALFGSEVTVLQRSKTLFASKQGDPEAAKVIQDALEKSGVRFVSGSVKSVETLRERPDDANEQQLPLMKVSVESTDGIKKDLECECLLVAAGRVANVENMGLEAANVEYEVGKGVKVNDLAQAIGNPNVYAVGDCVAGVPRLTHMSGEMAKLVVQNSLFGDNWKLTSLIVPATMYTEPEYATIGIASEEMAKKKGIEVDTYRTGLEHNDRAILEGSNVGFCKVFCRKGTDEIVGATIVAERAGEIINEVGLAMKNGIGLQAVGRNIHCYPTTGECVMMCGVQYINTKVLPNLQDKK